MYGPHAGQSWHEAWSAAAVPVGQAGMNEALTTVIRH